LPAQWHCAQHWVRATLKRAKHIAAATAGKTWIVSGITDHPTPPGLLPPAIIAAAAAAAAAATVAACAVGAARAHVARCGSRACLEAGVEAGCGGGGEAAVPGLAAPSHHSHQRQH
jgi:hypothetical protein